MKRSTRSLKQLFRRAVASRSVEALEGRVLFSSYAVTTLGDGTGTVTPAGTGKFNATTLRAATAAATTHPGSDTILFAAALVGTITLGKALPDIADTLVVTGPGSSKLSVARRTSASTDSSIFRVNAGKTVSPTGLKIAGGAYRQDRWTRTRPAGVWPPGYYDVALATNQAVAGKDVGNYLA